LNSNIPNTIYTVTRQTISEFQLDEDNIKREYIFLTKYIDSDQEHQNNFCKYEKIYNRYKDILPFEFNAININIGKEENHYINASGINAYQKNYFIATQGPKPATIKDFWTMIDEQGCQMIVMLCQLEENKKKKCENYWNTEFVQDIDECDETKWIFRRMKHKVPNSNEDRTITQIHFTEWKDKDVPEEEFDKFIDAFECIDRGRKNKNNQDTPVVVHCSAGVGRTGTFISMYYLYKEILRQIKQNKNEIKFSIFNLVRKLKEMRAYLVQTEDQYVFLYKFVHYFLKKILN
jgi:protein tyrosine phosphatase